MDYLSLSPPVPLQVSVSLHDGRAIWPFRFAVNSSRIFRNMTPSNAKWLKSILEGIWGLIWEGCGHGLGEDLALNLGRIWGFIWRGSGHGFGEGLERI